MANRISLASIFALLLMIQTVKISESWLTECRVYHRESLIYIYAKYKPFGLGSTREVLPYRTFLDDIYYMFNRNKIKFVYNDEDPSGIWLFEPVDGRKNTFYLRNRKYIDEYLRVSNNYLLPWYYRDYSVLVTKKQEFDDDELFMWRFDRIDDRSRRYYIWNVRFRLPLYHNKEILSRIQPSIFLKNDVMHDSKEFEWVLKCLDDLLPHTDE